MPARGALVVVLASSLLMAAGSGPVVESSELCTIVVHPGPDTSTTYALGWPLADTVRVGVGPVEPVKRPGHWGKGEARSVYGQVVRIQRLGGADSVRLARAFAERGDSSVLAVPWDYDAACRTTFWSRSARWAPAGEPGAFRSLRLRSEGEWVDGIPTFDVFRASANPYPGAPGYQGAYQREDAPDRTLTAREYYDLYSTLPRASSARSDPESAEAAMAAWEGAHGQLVEVAPGPRLARNVRSSIRSSYRRQVMNAIDSPVAGTWRFSFSLAEGGALAGERTLYARTRARPNTPWSSESRAASRERRTGPGLRPPPPMGYHLLLSGATSPDALPEDCRGDRRHGAEAYLMVEDPQDGADREQPRDRWIGQAETALLSRSFPEDSALADFNRDFFQERYMDRPDDAPLEVDGEFRRGADGVIRFQQVTVLRDGRTLTIEGERVSSRTIHCSW